MDVYTAEYAIKLAKDVSDKNKNNNSHTNTVNSQNNGKFKIDTLEQKSAFHIKVIKTVV